MLRFLKPYLKEIVVAVILMWVQIWSSLKLPFLMSKIVNDGIVGKNMQLVFILGGEMLFWTAISMIGMIATRFYSAKIGANINRDLKKELFQKTFELSVADVDDLTVSSLINRTMNDTRKIQKLLMSLLSTMAEAPITAIGAVIGAMTLAPDMAWIMAVSVMALMIIITIIVMTVLPKFEIYQKLFDKVSLLTRENLTGLKVIRSFNNEKIERKKFEQANHKLMKVDSFIGLVLSIEDPLITLIFNATIILCIWIGVSHLTFNPTYLGRMMAFTQYTMRTMGAFMILISLFVNIPIANVSARRLNEVLTMKPRIKWLKKTEEENDLEPNEREGDKNNGELLKHGGVVFDKVGFGYQGAEDKVLTNISFVARVGETTAFIGSTGSGKTTLAKLLLRQYDVSEGEILVDGKNIKKYSADDLMKKIGYVPQKGYLFSGTIKSNILFGAEKDNKEDMKKAAKIAQAEDFILELEEGFDAKITQGGTNVSGGQRQRISIARAIAKNPRIYIFDDAFSALDMKTDKKLRNELKKITKNTVTLVIAQRISTIREAEQIIVLDNGKIVGKGKHYDLILDSEVYKEICQSQFSDEEFVEELEIAENQRGQGVKN